MRSAQAAEDGRPGGAGAVLDLIRRGHATTRSQLMAATGLSRSTIAQRLEALTEAGYVVESGSADSTGGRPAGTLRPRPDTGVLVAADIGAEHIRTAVTDMTCQVLAHHESLRHIDEGPEAILGVVRDDVTELLRRAGRRDEDVRGLGIGVPGPVDFVTGQVVSPPIMTGWDGYDVRGYFAPWFAGPTLVDKDTNLIALGEHRVSWSGERHLLLVKAGTGIGSGLIVDGRLHRGSTGSAGDIGHVPAPGLAEDGEAPECRCGNLGCVEAYAGGWALVRDLRAEGYSVSETADVVALVRSGDHQAVRRLREAGRLLGYSVSEAVNLVNPSLVVVVGALAYAREHLLAGIREVTYRRSLPLATRDLRVVSSRLREMAGVIGGAHLAADTLFHPAAVDRAIRSLTAQSPPVSAMPSGAA